MPANQPLSAPILRPFWRYFGAKWRIAPRYPAPEYPTIIEPFAGAAGYSLRYHDRNVILVEKNPLIAEMWEWLIRVKPAEVRRIPYVESTQDLPAWVPSGARTLVGFCMSAVSASPSVNLSTGARRHIARGNKLEGWGHGRRELVATQVDRIRHWRVICGDYTQAPDIKATWFVDPPYVVAGNAYKFGSKGLDFPKLGKWCQSRRGQVLVCEAAGADWLPFQPFVTAHAGPNTVNQTSHEVLWTNGA